MYIGTGLPVSNPKASLVRSFNFESVVDGSISHTRNSAGTHRNSSGTLVTASSNTPRFHHDQNGNARGLLIEGPHTNLIGAGSTQNFSSDNWTPGRASVTNNVFTAPDGTTTGDRLVEDSTTGEHELIWDFTPAVSGHYVYSVFAANDGRTELRLFFAPSGTVWPTLAHQRFNTANGNLGLTGAGIEDQYVDQHGDWYRCGARTSASSPLQAVSVQLEMNNNSSQTNYTGNGSSGMRFWGADLGPGPYMTSYVPFGTREADFVTMPLSLSSQAISIVASGRTAFGTDDAGLGEQTLWQWDDGSTANLMRCYRNSFGGVRIQVISGGAEQTDSNLGTVADDTDLTTACRVAPNDFAGKLNGETLRTDDTIIMPTGLTTFRAGHGISGDHWDSTIKEKLIAQAGFPNAQLEAMAP